MTTQWEIAVTARADTKEAAISVFEEHVAALRAAQYDQNSSAAGGSCIGNKEGYSRYITPPQEEPLTLQEIGQVRKLRKGLLEIGG